MSKPETPEGGKPAGDKAKGWLNQGNHKELAIGAAAIIGLALYERSKSSSSAAAPAGTSSSTNSSAPAYGNSGSYNQLADEIGLLDAQVQQMQMNPDPLANSAPAVPSPSPAAPYVAPIVTSTSSPNPASSSTASPYTPLQIAQNSPGPSELSTQAANNAAWAKAYAANPNGNPPTKVSSSPTLASYPGHGVPITGSGSSSHSGSPVGVVKKTTVTAPQEGVPGHFFFVNGHRYFS